MEGSDIESENKILKAPIAELDRADYTELPYPTPIDSYQRPFQRRWLVPLVLFVTTCFSTWLSQWLWGATVIGGLEYAASLMAILLAHEMGHFLQAVRYGVPASLPMFIPMPITPIGTMGAVIVQAAGVADRKAMFDIAISGPLAGLVFAIPALIYGLQLSHVVQLPPAGAEVLFFGEPLIVQWLIRWQFGVIPPTHDVTLHPIAFAGWVGIFITALNLTPISQLDGGHILYMLLRKRAYPVARILWGGALGSLVFWGLTVSPDLLMQWALMLFLVWRMGILHPPTANDNVPLGWGRICLGWLTLLFFIIGFTPSPIYVGNV